MRKYVIAGLVTLALLATIPLSAYFYRRHVERMKASGGAVGIVNLWRCCSSGTTAPAWCSVPIG